MKTVLRNCMVNVLLLSSLGGNLAAMKGDDEKTPFLSEKSSQESSGSSSSSHPRPPAPSSVSSSSLSSSASPHQSLSDAFYTVEDSDDEKEDRRTRARRKTAQAAHSAQEAEDEKKMPPKSAQSAPAPSPLPHQQVGGQAAPAPAPAPQGNVRILSQVEFEQILASNKDFSNTDLRAIDLRGRDLSNTNLTGTVICGVDKDRLKDLTETAFKKATLTDTNLRFTKLDHTDLDEATLSHSDLSGSTIQEARLRGTKFLNGTLLINAYLTETTFHRATIADKAMFLKAILRGVKFLQTIIDGVDMSKIDAVKLFFIDCPIFKDINFLEAKITNMVIMDIGIIGPKINFDRAEIHESCFIGKIIKRNANPKERTKGITERDETNSNSNAVYWSTAEGVAEGITSGALMAAITAGVACIPFIGPPVSAIMIVAGTVASVKIGQEAANDNLDGNHIFAPININTIIKAANFTGAKLDKVRFSNIKFGDCTDIEGIETANGCVLSNVISSDPADLQRFKRRNAKVNGEYENALYGIVIEHDPDLSSMGEDLLRLAAGAALGAAGNAIGGPALGGAMAAAVLPK